jgi:hypothetical protein
LKSAAEPSLDNDDESFSSAGASPGPHFLNYSISLNSLFGFLRLMHGARRARSRAATGPNEMQFNGVGRLRSKIRRIRARFKKRRNKMTNLKALSAVIILSAAVATPVFAKEHSRAYDRYRGAYNQLTEPSYALPETQAGRNIENFGFSGRDPSRVGGWDPSLHPSGS